MKIEKSKPILVTGGSGYIASWIIKYLLEEGHTVHTTVRNKSKKENYIHLEKIASLNKGVLKIFEADLLKKDSFLESMKDCELVMHTASPFVVTGLKDPRKELIEPAQEGTANVLRSVNETNSVKRVILTSSCASIYGDNKDIKDTEYNIFTEKYWNISSSLEHNPYSYSKTIAEKKAWDMVRDQTRWDLVVINPAFVLGPSLTKRTDSTSINTMIQISDGTFFLGVPELWFGIVDVRDVAKSHILAGFNPNAKGRHILCSESLELLEIAKYLREEFGDKYLFPRWKVPFPIIWLFAPLLGFSHKYIETNIGFKIAFDNSYTKQDLGLHFTNVKKTICDHFQQLLDDGLISRK